MKDISEKKLLNRIEELENEVENLRSESPESNKTLQHKGKNISRRDFLKNIGVGAAGLGAMALLPSASAFNIRTSNPLQYFGSGSSNPDFEVQTDGSMSVNSINIGSNGSLSGLVSQAMAKGKVFADDGNIYDSIQTAVDNASNYVKVGPGTFNESIKIDTLGLKIVGSGHSTVIDSTGIGVAIDSSTASDVVVRSLRVKGDGNDNIKTGTRNRLDNIYVEGEASDNSIVLNNSSICINTILAGNSSFGVRTNGEGCIISNCVVRSESNYFSAIVLSSDDNIVSNCFVEATNVTNGIQNASSSDNVITGNRIVNSSDTGIYFNGSSDVILANNRVSDSANKDIDIATSSGIKTSGNLTGSSN